MHEEDKSAQSIPPKSAQPSTPIAGGNDLVERMRQLALMPLPEPEILNERLLSSPEQHVKFLKAAIGSARERVVIVSPYISIYRLNEDDDGGFYQDIKSATQRGVEVTVYTDATFDENKLNAIQGRQNLVKALADLKIIDRIHSKNLIVDDRLITFGSFNWLSAVINPGSAYCRYETTTIITGQDAPPFIQRIIGDLNTIPLRDREGFHAFYLECSPAQDDLRSAVSIHRKYARHPIYRLVTEEILSSHSEWDLNKSLAVIRVLQETGTPPAHLIQRIKEIIHFQVGDVREFLEILEILATISKEEAQRIAVDQHTGILTRIDRSRNYDDLDYIYRTLRDMGMEDLAHKVELYILAGEKE